jgi:hypothetical protein
MRRRSGKFWGGVEGQAPKPRAAELVAAQFDTVAAVAEGCDALVATGVMPTGVWR